MKVEAKKVKKFAGVAGIFVLIIAVLNCVLKEI